MIDSSETFTLQAAPPLEWVHAEKDLDEALVRLGGHFDERFDALFKEIEVRLFLPFLDHLRDARLAHGKAIAEAGLNLDNEDSTLVVGEALWQSLGAYRNAVARDVIVPLREKLEALDIGQTLTEIWSQYHSAMNRAGALCPVEIVRLEPEQLFASSPEDSVIRRLGKAGIRQRRAAALSWLKTTNRVRKLAGRPAEHAPPKSQRVPLSHLADYHVRVRLGKPLTDLHEALAQLFSQPIAFLESSLSKWTYEILEARWKLDRPVYHIDAVETPGMQSTGELGADTAVALTAFSAARALSELLAKLSQEDASLRVVSTPAKIIIEEAFEDFKTDISRVGSFMLAQADRAMPVSESRFGKRTEERLTAWANWHRRTAARMKLLNEQIQLALALEEVEEKIIAGVSSKAVKPALEASQKTTEALRALHVEAEKVIDEAEAPAKKLSTFIGNLLKKALKALEHDFIEYLAHNRLAGEARSICERNAVEVMHLVQRLPVRLEVNALQEIESISVNPNVDLRGVPLRRFAENAFDALLVERIRSAHKPLSKTLEEIQKASTDLPSIVRFNLEAALEELAPEGNREQAEAGASPVPAAKELTLGGLARTADAVMESTGKLGDALFATASSLDQVFTEGWIGFHERGGLEGKVQEQMADALTRLRGESRAAVNKSTALVHKKWRQLLAALHLGRNRAAKLVRLGQTALGVVDSSEVETRETIDALIELDALFEGLPLVYRRLFSFRPVTDPTLLTGRSRDIERVEKHIDQWKRGRTNALLLVGPYGGGHTSLLNVLRSGVLDGMETHTIEITERWTTEDVFAARVVEALELDPVLTSLAGIRDALSDKPGSEQPIVILVEHLEHLLMRTVGGTNFIERVLTFMSRTDARILWIVTITDYSWQLIEKTEAAAASLVVHHPMEELNRDALEALILNRHRRSGIPLVFEAPLDPHPLLKRKLRRTRDRDEQQAILQANYFDRLAQMSAPNVMLALFYWLKSIQLDEEKQLINVLPARALSFGFLSQFELNHAFSLKAFLEHATLTLAEHSEIFNMSEEESLEIFEALGNRLLIQPVEEQPPSSRIEFSTIDEQARYRIRPLLIQPVTQFLRGKNIVY